MGILDVFTGDPARDAADKQRALLEQTQKGIYDRTQGAKGLAAGFLNTGYDAAKGDLGTGYGAATGAINAGAGSATNYLDQGTAGAIGQLNRARGDLTANGGACRLQRRATTPGAGSTPTRSGWRRQRAHPRSDRPAHSRRTG